MKSAIVTVSPDGQVTIPEEMLRGLDLEDTRQLIMFQNKQGFIELRAYRNIVEKWGGKFSLPKPTASEYRDEIEEAVVDFYLQRQARRAGE
jgi:bifunctional DNA-binding transcriptional regulator/antitoxin component of YhaV-PrlF toxin-antitoxin module